MQQFNVYNSNMERCVLHCDLNNFYASVAQKAHPEYDGLPLAVSGNPKMRHGIILAKNQLAKKDGVQTAETIWEAKRKCPNLVLVEPDYEEYMRYSNEVFSIYTQYTDRVEKFGIDECWLDVTASLKLFGNGVKIADELREKIKKQTGLTISVGVSFTKVLAKLGSDIKKPDATTLLSRENYMNIIGALPASELIMIGRKTAEKLKQLNIRTIRELANADRDMLRCHFGVIGDNMINAANGEDKEEVKLYYDERVPKSISNGTTTYRDIVNAEEAKVVVYALSELIAVRMRKHNLVADGIGIYLKNTELHTVSKQKALAFSTSNAADIAKNALELLMETHNFNMPLRAITVAAIRLKDKSHTQLSLFDDLNEREEKLEETLDKIRDKYGYHSVKRGVLLQNDLTGNLKDDDGYRPFLRQ